MTRLFLDFETRSMLDLKTVGLDRYARSAEVLMLAWAIDDAEPELWLPGAVLPTALTAALGSHAVTKVAYNAAFEREILKYHFNYDYPPAEWLDPAVLARYATLPGKLAGASEYLGLGDLSKHTSGTRLISKFCKPYKGEFRKAEDHPDDWKLFCDYCLQDVRAERAVLERLEKVFSLPPFERRVEQIDAEINARGIPVDMQFVNEAKKLVAAEKKRLADELRAITGLANPNSGAQMLPWLRERGYPFSSLLKKRVDQALLGELAPEVRNVLNLRSKLSRSSTSKLDALIDRTGPDGRLRHSYKYLGASRTGRWAGSGAQLHNLPR
jgi:DNA polymerase